MNGAFFESEIRRLERKIEELEAKCGRIDETNIEFLRRLVRLERSERRKKPDGEVKLRVADIGR